MRGRTRLKVMLVTTATVLAVVLVAYAQNFHVSGQVTAQGTGSHSFMGKVGIGTNAPAQKLSVVGTIESTTGGLKYPNATTQVTALKAALGLQGCAYGQWVTGFTAGGQVVCSTLDPGIPTFTSKIAAGFYNTCGVMSDKTLLCWGENTYGQVGDNNSTSSQTTPVFARTVAGIKLANVVSVASGNANTCAVLGDGTIWCWGYNNWGQLGDGTTANRTQPVQVSGMTNATQVCGGWYETCARKSDGTVWCWGYGANGELGNGANLSSYVPVQVSGITTATQVSCSAGQYECALLADGTVKCWGYNNYGQLGNGTTTASNVPVAVTGLTGVTALSSTGGGYYSAGWYIYPHNCVRKSDSTIWCWGYGGNGELGTATAATSYAPVQASGITTAVGISTGTFHSCAWLSDGTARCWGNNTQGELGTGNTTPSNTPVVVSGIGGAGTLSGVVSITGSATYYANGYYGHNCAALSNGKAACWGDGNYGQLGNNSTSQRLFPVGVQYP